MGSRKPSNYRMTDRPEAAAGWPELHGGLQAGIPHAVEIIAALDSFGFSYPTSPSFAAEAVELRSYRVVHQAWREGVLGRWLTVLGAWRTFESQLPAAARLPEFQQALLEFLTSNRQIDPQILRTYLAGRSLADLMPPGETATVENLRRRLELVWNARWC